MKKSNKHERTLKMMENFMQHHNDGMTIKQIAQKYDLVLSTVYKNLQTIADKAGVSRESLLEVVHSPHILSSWVDKPVEKVDSMEFGVQITAVRAEVGKLQQSVRNSIKTCENFEKRGGLTHD